jgi:Bacterial surface proteins containing Ig-like domains
MPGKKGLIIVTGVVLIVIVAAVAFMMLSGDDDDTVSNRVVPTSIEVEGDSLIGLDETTSLTAKVLPDDANQSVNWSSSDSDIMTVDKDGNVTSKNIGKATITATSTLDSSVTGALEITVTDIAPTKIQVGGAPKMGLNMVQTLTVTVSPTDAVRTVTWASSNTDILTVNSRGEVTAKAVGTTKVTATSTKDTSISGEFVISVTDDAPTDIYISGASRMGLNATQTLTLRVAPANAVQTVTWSSTNEGVLTVNSDGEVTAKAAGTAKVIATSTKDSSITGEISITVSASVPIEIEIEGNEVMTLGSSQTLTAIVTPSDSNQAVKWTFSGPYITVSPTGVVTAVAVGSGVAMVSSVEEPAISATFIIMVVNA